MISLFFHYLHDLASHRLIFPTVEEASLASIEVHISRKEVDHLESVTLEDIIDLDEIGIDTMNIPEGEAHDDIAAEFRESESSEEISI